MGALTNLLGTILKFIYDTLQGFGNEPKYVSYYALALIIMCLLQKLLTMPMTLKATKNAQKGQELSAEVKKIQDKYKNDPQTAQRKVMEFYKEKNYNPASGCLPMLIPIIIIWAMIGVIRNPELYIFGQNAASEIAKNFLWIQDLTKPDPYIYGLPLIYAASMFLYSSVVQPKNAVQDAQAQSMNMMMKYMMPVMMFFFARTWGSGLILFWATSNIIEVIVRLITSKLVKPGEEA